jgi:CHAT domain-containing protein
LTRAFFYAGARTLFASHWPVYFDAAVQLLDRTFEELHAHPAIGRSEAFRRAMIALIDDPTLDDNPHPSVWAAFSVMGDRRQAQSQLFSPLELPLGGGLTDP